MEYRNSQRRKKFALTKLVSACALACACSQVVAGGFSLYGEANGRNAGDFAAGAAAEAADASTLYYNPAGLVELDGEQIVIAGTLVHAKAKLANNGTLVYTPAPFPASTLSLANLRSSSTEAIPALFYAKSIEHKIAWGVGVFVPFGLATDWGEQSNARYSATRSALQIIDISPAFAAKLNDQWNIGAGLDMQFAKVDINSVGGIPTPFGSALDSTSVNHGSSIGVGAHIGLLYKMNTKTKFGLNYQSGVVHEFEGYSQLTGRLADPLLANPNFTSRFNGLRSDPTQMPDQVTFSGTHRYNSKVTLMGTAAYVRWSVIPSITMRNVVSTGGALVNVTLPENFRNTFRVAGGVKYDYSQKVQLRMGLGYDQSPVNNTDRNLRLPDDDRIALAIGGHYQATQNVGIDVGWTHLFIKDTNINGTTTAGTSTSNVVAGVKSSADLFGAQLTWKLS